MRNASRDESRAPLFYELRDDTSVPVICPTCQNVFRRIAQIIPGQTTPCYFAWGCFRHFRCRDVSTLRNALAEHFQYQLHGHQHRVVAAYQPALGEAAGIVDKCDIQLG